MGVQRHATGAKHVVMLTASLRFLKEQHIWMNGKEIKVDECKGSGKLMAFELDFHRPVPERVPSVVSGNRPREEIKG